VETDRWYDLKVEVRGAAVKCWMDGRLIHDLKNTLALTRGLFASATREDASGDVIVKIVNASHSATETEVQLNGAERLASEARLIVLTSEKPTDENSLEEPLKVSPKTETLKLSGTKFKHTFPGNSLTILRVRETK
jgi:alpha-L-arabinofuranosidase